VMNNVFYIIQVPTLRRLFLKLSLEKTLYIKRNKEQKGYGRSRRAQEELLLLRMISRRTQKEFLGIRLRKRLLNFRRLGTREV
ncbi:MAG: hypothetical protein KAW12_08325, partial [Candidatus Aminicenantes bacterium]|nr:hypothetical protein [Candidatus Aminicenantes bacterium]